MPCYHLIPVERPKDQYNQYHHGTLVQFGADETTDGGSVWSKPGEKIVFVKPVERLAWAETID
jgi:hypothetical protein